MADPRLKKPKERFLQELNVELNNLRIACEQWELGHYEQTTVIAKSLRTLLHDHGNTSQSLFRHLRWKERSFVTTHGYVRTLGKTLVRQLAMQDIVGWLGKDPTEAAPYRFRWMPRYFYSGKDRYDLDYRPVWDRAPFLEWWEESVLANDEFRVSRKDLILSVTNELGGTHSASMIKPKTAAILEGKLNHLSITSMTLGSQTISSQNCIHDAVIRQIAFELQKTVERHYATFVQEPIVVPPLPEDWRAEGQYVRGKQDPTYVTQVLQNLDRHGQTDTVLAEDLRAQVYWHARAHDMLRRGLWG
jgi:hypothetical protein